MHISKRLLIIINPCAFEEISLQNRIRIFAIQNFLVHYQANECIFNYIKFFKMNSTTSPQCYNFLTSTFTELLC